MYVDSPPVTVRRSADTRRVRSALRKATSQTRRVRPVSAAERRTRLTDAIVSQWLLEQVPSDHRHDRTRSASGRHAGA